MVASPFLTMPVLVTSNPGDQLVPVTHEERCTQHLDQMINCMGGGASTAQENETGYELFEAARGHLDR